jgi:hypothetical protein
MDKGLFEVLGKYAGIGGISIGLILVLYGQMASTAKTKAGLPASLSYRLLRLLVVLTFVIGVLGIAAWLTVTLSSPTANSISGNIRDRATGLGIENVQVIVGGQPESATSIAGGNYTLNFAVLPAKGVTLTLYFTKDGYKASNREAHIGDSSADAELVSIPSNVSPVLPDHGHAQSQPTVRVLTPDKAAVIQACLTEHPVNNKTEVWFVGKADDSWTYASEISHALQGPMLNESLNDTGNPMMPLGPLRDVAVRSRFEDDGAAQLRKCLVSGGVRAHLDIDPLGATQNPLLEGYLPAGKIDVVVGPKS